MMPEIYFVVAFFILNGVISPDFGDFSYYFMLNVCSISKFQYSMMGIVGQFTTILGTMYYEAKLKDIEVRTLIYWSTVISIISGFCSLGFALRLNVKMGISDMIYVVCTDTFFGVISQAMNLLPCLALFAKVTPKRIEGTVFAFLTGATNLASTVISPLIGVWINEKFVGVNAENIGPKNYKWLCIIQLIACFMTFLIIPLVPT